MNLPLDRYFITGFLALLYFTYQDYKHSEIENEPILAFGIMSLVFAGISGQFWLNIVLMAIFFAMSLLLWKMKCFGGADVKILPLLVPFLGLNGIGQAFAGMILFLLLFAGIGGLYGLLGKFLLHRREIPFLGAITATFCVFWYYKSQVF